MVGGTVISAVTVEFRVLGPLEVATTGVARPGGRQAARLLAILLLNANQVVSTDRLIDELWGAEAPETAPKALQVHVSQLRKVLEPDRARRRVRAGPGHPRTRLPARAGARRSSTSSRFERLAAEGREALAAADPSRRRRACCERRSRSGVALRSPSSPTPTSPSARSPASRSSGSRSLEDRIQADLDCGRHAEVIGELETLVAEEPLRERPRAQLMLALYRSGRQAEALEAYRSRATHAGRGARDRARASAQGARGARSWSRIPSLEGPATVSKHASRPPIAVEESADAAAPAESFVGRERELAEFRAALDGAFAGRMSLLLIAGEPGIGKSRLADEVTSVAVARGACVLWGRCWEAGGAPGVLALGPGVAHVHP